MAEKQAVTEILTYWERLGLEKGLEKGREEGREEGLGQGLAKGIEKMRRVMTAMIEAKFGPMPAEDAGRLAQFSLNSLEEFGLAMATATSYEELQQRFFTL